MLWYRVYMRSTNGEEVLVYDSWKKPESLFWVRDVAIRENPGLFSINSAARMETISRPWRSEFAKKPLPYIVGRN